MDRIQIRAAIIGGIISAVIVIIFINPLLNFVWSFVIWSGDYLYQGYVDRIYKSAALGTRNYVSVLIFWFIIYFLLISATVSIVSLLTYGRRRTRGFAKLRSAMSKKYVVVIVYLLAVAVGLLLMAVVFADLQLNTTFNQRLAVLSPKIDELQRKELLAAWATMESRKDYESIMEKMDNVAAQHSISLPKPLIK